jgi:hypothetical protein
MSGWWGFWLLGLVLCGFAIPEARAILSKQHGDTLSENVRRWLKTETPGGGWTFAGVWGCLLVVWIWFLGHILDWWW